MTSFYPASGRAPSVIDLRVSSHSVVEATYTVGESFWLSFQRVSRQAVLLPESFRGGCSFGAGVAGLSHLHADLRLSFGQVNALAIAAEGTSLMVNGGWFRRNL